MSDATPVPRRTRMSFQRWFRTIGWRHLVGFVALAFTLFPVVFIISSSLNPLGSLGSSKLFPSDVSLINYRDLLNGTDAPYRVDVDGSPVSIGSDDTGVGWLASIRGRR